MAKASDQIRGTVRAGLIPSVVRGILPSFLPAFVEQHPAIDLCITESFSGTLTGWLLAREIDLAVVVEPPAHEGLVTERLAEGPAVLITGRAAGLAGTLANAARGPWARDSGSCIACIRRRDRGR